MSQKDIYSSQGKCRMNVEILWKMSQQNFMKITDCVKCGIKGVEFESK